MSDWLAHNRIDIVKCQLKDLEEKIKRLEKQLDYVYDEIHDLKNNKVDK